MAMAKQTITDEESNLRRQARRRLIGAIALTILVVVLLPMILDSEPPATSQDIELKIPDKDKAGEFVPKMVLPPLNANDAASQPASAPVIAPLLDVKPATELVQPKTEAKPRAVIEQKITQPDVKSKDETKPAAKTSSTPHSGFVVQIGAYANADAAKKLHEKLHKQGYPSYTEKIGNKIRVRVGSYTTHAEADKVRRKLEIQGLQPNVVNLTQHDAI